MVTLVCENKNKHIGARPLMLQQTYLHSYRKGYINEWQQLPWQFIGFVFLLEEELVSKKVL